jgi:putative transposase
MSESLSHVLLRLVFSTKGPHPSLRDDSFRGDMHRHLADVSKRLNCAASIVGETEDHMHLLIELPRTITIADLVKELKRASSAWAKHHHREFQWQNGYRAFSASESL